MLKNQPFKLVYIDAFAGSGQVDLGNPDPDASAIISGSSERAVRIGSRPFDRLYYVENGADSCRHIEQIMSGNRNRDIRIQSADANTFLCKLRMNWNAWRGVIFLDPFATQVAWSTVERIAAFNALDMWILFPTSAIARMLPLTKTPDDIHPGWASRLTRVYGGQGWRRLYSASLPLDLFEARQGNERDPGVDGLLNIYRENLKAIFDDRFMDKSRTLRNSRGGPVFELLFCVGNCNGIRPAKRIANHILDHF